MKYPDLVRDKDCKIPAKIIIFGDGLDEDGAPKKSGAINKKCNYQSTGTRVSKDREENQNINGVLYFNGDIFENLEEISGGEVEIFNEVRQIVKYTKARNPDGTVNYTKVEVQ